MVPKDHAAARAIHISEWPLQLPDAVETFGSELQLWAMSGPMALLQLKSVLMSEAPVTIEAIQILVIWDCVSVQGPQQP